MAAKKAASKAGAQQQKIASLVAKLDKSLKKVGDKEHEAELRSLLADLHKAHVDLYTIAVGDGWQPFAGWQPK